MNPKYLERAKAQLAEYDLTIEDLTQEERDVLLYEVRDDKSGVNRLLVRRMSETTLKNIAYRKSLIENGTEVPEFYRNLAYAEYIEIVKLSLDSWSLTVEDLTEEELGVLVDRLKYSIRYPRCLQLGGPLDIWVYCIEERNLYKERGEEIPDDIKNLARYC